MKTQQQNRIDELNKIVDKYTLIWLFEEEDKININSRFYMGIPFYIKEYSENVKFYINKGGYISDDYQRNYWNDSNEFYDYIQRVIAYREKYSTISLKDFKNLIGKKVDIWYSDYNNGRIEIQGIIKEIKDDGRYLEVKFENGKEGERDINSWTFYYLDDEFGVMAGDDSNEIDIYVEQ